MFSPPRPRPVEVDGKRLASLWFTAGSPGRVAGSFELVSPALVADPPESPTGSARGLRLGPGLPYPEPRAAAPPGLPPASPLVSPLVSPSLAPQSPPSVGPLCS
ncbi:unnamed protein product [Boreogadus saida]